MLLCYFLLFKAILLSKPVETEDGWVDFQEQLECFFNFAMTSSMFTEYATHYVERLSQKIQLAE